MSVTGDVLRGHTDTILLCQLLHKDSYGYEINKRIQARTGKACELKEATLYTAFRRLEQAGLIRSYWGNEDTGARRRYYAITEEGRAAYYRSKAEWELSRSLIDALLAEEAQEEEHHG